jgi:16S rRNA processing protein RimM
MTAEEYVRIGVITGAHGLTGRLKILVITDISERYEAGNKVFIQYGDRYREHRIIQFSDGGKKSGLLQLDGIDNRDAALALKGSALWIEQSEAESAREALGEEGFFYYFDIIGCAAYTRGRLLGTVSDILEAGSGEVLVITDETGREFMVPFVESMVDTSDIRDKKLYLDPVEGLLDI